MWKIKHIFDGEYGCEELAEGQRPKVSVTLDVYKRQVLYAVAIFSSPARSLSKTKL